MPGSVDNDPVALVLSKLRKKKAQGSGWLGLCPAHDDEKFSLSVGRGKNGGVVLHCFTGCSYEKILTALNLKPSDVRAPRTQKKPKVQIVKTYPYTDAAGTLIYQKVRFEPKDFFQRRFDQAGRSVWALSAGWYEFKSWGEKSGFYKAKLNDGSYAEDKGNKPHADAVWFDKCPRYVYGLPKIQSLTPGSRVFSFEGEKGADRAGDEFAITSVAIGGATAWRSHFAEYFRGLDLIIFPDNDTGGRTLAKDQATDCLNIASRVRIVELPGLQPKQDIYDWIESGGTFEQLEGLIETALDFKPDATEEGALDEIEVIGDDPPISSDEAREKYLRKLARNTAKVTDAVVQIFNKLGFQEDHTRLLNTLTICARDRFGTIGIKHDWLATKYPRGGMSTSTVARDITKLIDEQGVIGVELLGYTPGTKNPNLDYGHASKFALHFLRYALQAISLAIDTKGDFDYSFQALDAACDVIVAQIPRVEKKKSAKVEDRERAEIKAEQTSGSAVREQAKSKVRRALDKFYAEMLDAGFSIEEAVEALSDEYNDATTRAALQTERVEESRPPIKRADHRIDTEITNQKDSMVSTLENEGLHGQQNDDQARARVASGLPQSEQEINEGRAGPDQPDSCDGCGAYMVWGSSFCASCGAHYRPEYWQAGTSERFHASD